MANNNTCIADDCGRPRKARQMCTKHYARWLAHGDASDLDNGRLRRSPRRDYVASFDKFVDKGSDCHNWTGMIAHTGYGQFSMYGKKVAAHRRSWEMANGPIPDGLVINHLCWNRACVNVEHLELVTVAENCYYRSGPSSNSSSGVRGVSWNRKFSKWRGVLYKNNKQVATKYFPGTDAGLREAADYVEAGRAELYGRHAGF